MKHWELGEEIETIKKNIKKYTTKEDIKETKELTNYILYSCDDEYEEEYKDALLSLSDNDISYIFKYSTMNDEHFIDLYRYLFVE